MTTDITDEHAVAMACALFEVGEITHGHLEGYEVQRNLLLDLVLTVRPA